MKDPSSHIQETGSVKTPRGMRWTKHTGRWMSGRTQLVFLLHHTIFRQLESTHFFYQSSLAKGAEGVSDTAVKLGVWRALPVGIRCQAILAFQRVLWLGSIYDLAPALSSFGFEFLDSNISD